MIKFVVYLRKRKMKMKLNIFTLFLASALLSGFSAKAQDSGMEVLDRSHSKEFREALRLHDYGMYSRSRQAFDELSRKTALKDIPTIELKIVQKQVFDMAERCTISESVSSSSK